MTEIHDVLYPPKENDARVEHRRYDGKERLVAWSVRQDDHFLLFRVNAFREVTLENGDKLDVPETIECRFSQTDIDPDSAFADVITYDAFGARESQMRCDGYGNIIPGSEVDPLKRGDYAWTGREMEVDSELIYHRARYYDSTSRGDFVDEIELQSTRARHYCPAVGRWISEDPLGSDAGTVDAFPYPSITKIPDSTIEANEDGK